MCKKIHRGGNAEQYHADKKYKEAVAEAVEVCADDTIVVQGNLANAYQKHGRLEDALLAMRDVYLGFLKLEGKAGKRTLAAANNYINLLRILKRFKEARSLLRKTTPLAQRVLGEGHQVTLTMKKMKAEMLYDDDGATPDDLREAVEIFEDIERTSRRLLGAAHPRVFDIELNLKSARAKLRAREDA